MIFSSGLGLSGLAWIILSFHLQMLPSPTATPKVETKKSTGLAHSSLGWMVRLVVVVVVVAVVVVVVVVGGGCGGGCGGDGDIC